MQQKHCLFFRRSRTVVDFISPSAYPVLNNLSMFLCFAISIHAWLVTVFIPFADSGIGAGAHLLRFNLVAFPLSCRGLLGNGRFGDVSCRHTLPNGFRPQKLTHQQHCRRQMMQWHAIVSSLFASCIDFLDTVSQSTIRNLVSSGCSAAELQPP